MIRRVAFGKAILAGALGAAAWEAAVRLLISAGVPLTDITFMLGTMFDADAPWSVWWPLGLVMHMSFGVLWALFYAYFVWSELPWRPTFLAIAFALLIPTMLAGLVMMPQMGWMSPLVLDGDMPHPGVFGLGLGWGGPAGSAFGHLVYGLVLGVVYRRPVGYAVGHRPKELPHAA